MKKLNIIILLLFMLVLTSCSTELYNITFIDMYGEVIEMQKVKPGEEVLPPEAPIVPNYTFSGWDQDLTNVMSDMTVQAEYTRNICKVTFVDMHGEVIEIKEVESGEEVIAPEAPTVPYYTFSGWDKELTNITKDITVQAKYSESENNYNIEDYNYWLQILSKTYDINKPILSYDEIKAYNENVKSDYNKTKVLDVLAIEDKVTGNFVNELINSYNNMYSYTVYNNETGNTLTNAEKNEILENRNLNDIENEVSVEFGLISDFAWMRTYPTKNYSSTYERDRFQETTLNVGEVVAVYHTSADGNWKFVQATNYYGWVESEYIAVANKEEVANFINHENRIVVISDYVIIENAHVRMGQSFPLVSEDDKYHIQFPIRKADGTLEVKEVTLEKNDNFSKGYLEYTYENLFKQAFKLLGIDYSWGDKEKDGRDCSSTQNGIYACFGFSLPRNTSNQNSIPYYGAGVYAFSIDKLKTYYKPGTLIFSSGHVMMYIGENKDGTSYILHNTSAGNGKCILQTVESYGIRNIIATLSLQ